MPAQKQFYLIPPPPLPCPLLVTCIVSPELSVNSENGTLLAKKHPRWTFSCLLLLVIIMLSPGIWDRTRTWSTPVTPFGTLPSIMLVLGRIQKVLSHCYWQRAQ